jgi:hypothetical protein
VHQARIAALRAEWGVVSTALQPLFPAQSQPVEAVMQHVSGTGEDMQELMAALFIEPFGDLVDWLADPYCAFAPPLRDTDALGVDYAAPDDCGQFWYVSAAKMEPRMGLRLPRKVPCWRHLWTSRAVSRRPMLTFLHVPRLCGPF